MADAPLETLIARTQEVLQPLIAKPKLADKLLTKPPFRFLHDVFTALMQATGFAPGLYSPFELDSANMKEKAHKITFLDKMAHCVGVCLGRDVDVRAAKIVAGLEPEHTNLFLQDMAAAAASSMSAQWARAVQQTLAKFPSEDGAEAKSEPAAAATPAAVAATAAAAAPEAKERGSSPSDAEKAAAAEQKARERAKREKEKAAAAAAAAAAAEAEANDNNSASNNNNNNNATPGGGGGAADSDEIRACNGDCERTKEMLEAIISKPKMAIKLLSKPPFRFLHDLISEVTRVTGFAEGLFAGDELDSATIKEKQPKIDYLTKILLCVSCHLNVEIEAKPAKIVAGLEAEETNKFLQLLAVACRHGGGESSEAVRRVLAGDTAVRATAPSSAKQSAREVTPEAKLSSRSTTPQEEKKSRADRKPSAKEPVAAPPPAQAKPSVTPGAFGGPMKVTDDGDGDGDEEGTNLRFGANDRDGGGNDDTDLQQQHAQAPGTSGGLGTSRTSRPTTARRRPPKLKENATEVGRLLVPDATVAPVTGLMKDGDNADSDEEKEEEEDALGLGGENSRASRLLPGDERGHGRLVRDLLKDEQVEAAARREKEDEDAAGGGGGPTIEAETGIRLGRRKKSFKDKSKSGASSAAEMQELRLSIQRICQAALPVGKSLEFVHDDLDAMGKELEQWKKEHASKCTVYEEERKKTEDALQPLHVQLLEVDEQIKEQVHKINSLRATIAKNEEKTLKLLRMVVSA